MLSCFSSMYLSAMGMRFVGVWRLLCSWNSLSALDPPSGTHDRKHTSHFHYGFAWRVAVPGHREGSSYLPYSLQSLAGAALPRRKQRRGYSWSTVAWDWDPRYFATCRP